MADLLFWLLSRGKQVLCWSWTNRQNVFNNVSKKIVEKPFQTEPGFLLIGVAKFQNNVIPWLIAITSISYIWVGNELFAISLAGKNYLQE